MNFKSTSGPVLEKPADLVGMLTNQREGDVLFIDEIHRLPAYHRGVSLSLHGGLPGGDPSSRRPRAQTMTMDIERFTLVGATTRFGPPHRAHASPLRHHPTAEFLSTRRVGGDRGAELGDSRCGVFARKGRRSWPAGPVGRPGWPTGLLRRVRDFAQVKAEGVITLAVAEDALKMLDVDEYGLDEMDGRVLHTLIEKFEGGPVGLETLAVAIGRGRLHAGGGLRAVPHPGGVHYADAAGGEWPP